MGNGRSVEDNKKKGGIDETQIKVSSERGRAGTIFKTVLSRL